MNFNLRSHLTMTRLAQVSAAGLGVLALAACGPTPHPGPSASASPTSKSAAAYQAGTAHAANVAEPVHPGECASSALTTRVAPYDAGAGHRYSRMTFGNSSGAACYVRGYPGVSYVAGADGHQVGGSAIREPGRGVRTVWLAPGGHAYAFIDQAEARDFPAASCDPAAVRGYRVYPPDETAAEYVRSRSTQCGNPSVGRPRIGPVTADPNGL